MLFRLLAINRRSGTCPYIWKLFRKMEVTRQFILFRDTEAVHASCFPMSVEDPIHWIMIWESVPAGPYHWTLEFHKTARSSSMAMHGNMRCILNGSGYTRQHLTCSFNCVIRSEWFWERAAPVEVVWAFVSTACSSWDPTRLLPSKGRERNSLHKITNRKFDLRILEKYNFNWSVNWLE